MEMMCVFNVIALVVAIACFSCHMDLLCRYSVLYIWITYSIKVYGCCGTLKFVHSLMFPVFLSVSPTVLSHCALERGIC